MSTTLTIEVSDDLHAQLERRANAHQHSLDEEVIRMLKNTVNDADREATWNRIDHLREEGPTIELDPTELKRLMREGLA